MNTSSTTYEPSLNGDLINCDVQLDLEIDRIVEIPATAKTEQIMMSEQGWQTVAETAAHIPSAPHTRARSRLLSMADGYLRSGLLCQALELYLDLMAGYPESVEAAKAEERCLEVAERHEMVGELRQARAIYERLA